MTNESVVDSICPETEFSKAFVTAMKARMTISFHKYGAVADAYPHKVNAISSLQIRLQKYRETGNTEWLVDAANFCMIEFMLPAHPNAHFKGTDSGDSPGREKFSGGVTRKHNLDIPE